MAFLKSSELFTYILETAPGVYNPVVSATDVDVRLREMTWENTVERDNEASTYMTGTYFGSDESIVGKKTVKASYKLKMAPGQYTSGAPALHVLEYDNLLTNCGLETIGVGTTSANNSAGLWAFYPDQSKSQATMSIARVLYDAETNSYQVSTGGGAMSNFSIAAEGVSAPFTISFDTEGRSEKVVDATTGVAQLDETKIMHTVADAMRNTTVKIKDLDTNAITEFCISSLTLESGNELAQIECQNTDSGINSYIITKINPSITLNPLLKTLAQFNWWEALSTERFYQIEIDSEYIHIFIPRAQMQAGNPADANGFMRVDGAQFRCLINIDETAPSWIPVGQLPTNLSTIPYFLGIDERAPQY